VVALLRSSDVGSEAVLELLRVNEEPLLDNLLSCGIDSKMRSCNQDEI
jgi:aryl carrier-like protein